MENEPGGRGSWFIKGRIIMNNKNANILCIISLILNFIMPVVTFLIVAILTKGDILGATAAAYEGINLVEIVSYIAAWALVIIARVKYKSKFAQNLLIIYGILHVLGVIGVIVVFCILFGIFLLW